MTAKHRITLCCLLLLLSVTLLTPAQAQFTNLDTLSNCNFSALAGRDDIQVGAVILNLETGDGCTENLDMLFPVASVPKLFVLGAYLEKVSLNELSFTQQTVFTRDYWMGGRSDTLNESRIGDLVTLGELSEIMIARSDNAATWMLMDEMGWSSVQAYVDRLGIDGIGTVIPYSEVDRLKLEFLDEQWANVPNGIASRFYRRRIVDEDLVPTYFNSVPFMSDSDRRNINEQYFTTYDFNTITPRAMAEYIFWQRENLFTAPSSQATAARWFFNTMLLTQRQYSTQALPGTTIVGAKNGFDYGLRAEVNVTVPAVDAYAPQTIIIIFARQTDFSADDLQRPSNSENGVLNQLLGELSVPISQTLYPSFIPPVVNRSENIVKMIFQTQEEVNTCWNPFATSDFTQLNVLESCFNAMLDKTFFEVGDNLSLGLILRGLDGSDTRLVLIYTAPDGRQFSYQTQWFFTGDAGFTWNHPVDQAGIWTVDLYINLERVSSRLLQVEDPEQ